MNNKEKLLFFTPHLSTGGLPQVLVNKISLLKDEYDILCVEHHNHAWLFNVQRNRVLELIGEDKLITLDDSRRKEHFTELLTLFDPDLVCLEEFPEYFLEDEITAVVYNKQRKYKVFETTHDSSFPVQNKRWFPDKFLFVSPFNAFRYSVYDIPYEVIEYPVDFKSREQEKYKELLGLEKDCIHIVNVGLFTQRKNQGYLFEIARKLQGQKFRFHFLGNQAGNFEDYWGPLMNNKPDNCIVWGERNDVYNFLQAADLFFFASKGDRNNKELNPIAIKEALEYKMPMMMFNLDVYCGKYDIYDNITYLTGDINQDTNLLLKKFNMDNLQNLMHISYEKDDNKINIFYSGYDPIDYKVSFKCLTSGAPMYWMNFKADSPLGWFVIPIPQHIMKFHQLATFRGFSLDFYDQNDNLRYSHEIVVNDIFPRLPKVNFEPFDCSFRNYIEFFSDDIYGSFNLNDMDTVIDVGANIGLFAKYMYAKDAKKVILVEANPLLDKNIKTVLGSDYENSPVYLAPLTGKKQNIKFHYSTKNSTIGTHTFDNSNPSYSDLDSTMDLETITFDEIVNENNLTNISLFKCDIEGGEYELIESLTDEQMNMIEKFIIEFHGNNNGELIPMVDKLTKFGFECELFTLHMTRKERVNVDESHGVLITKRKK